MTRAAPASVRPMRVTVRGPETTAPAAPPRRSRDVSVRVTPEVEVLEIGVLDSEGTQLAVLRKMAPDHQGRVWEYVAMLDRSLPIGVLAEERPRHPGDLSRLVSMLLATALAAGAVLCVFSEDHTWLVLPPASTRIEVSA